MLRRMTSDEALRDIRGYASANRITFSRHGGDRGQERSAHYRDVRHALTHAFECFAQKNGCWRAHGNDLDGDLLRIVLAIEDGVIIVTVMGD